MVKKDCTYFHSSLSMKHFLVCISIIIVISSASIFLQDCFVLAGTFVHRSNYNANSRHQQKSKIIQSSLQKLNPKKNIMSLEASINPPEKVVIAGAGVIGTSTAYYLATKYSIPSVTLVDPSGRIAPAASGKAGGFLALDWNDYSPVRDLARRSFALHEKLAQDLGGPDKIMYRRLTCAAISVDETTTSKKPSGKKLQGVEWVDSTVSSDIRMLGDEGTIAQVHPKMLCDALWEKVMESSTTDASLVKGKVLEPVFSQNNNDNESNKVIGVKLEDGSILEADAVLFACGPWNLPNVKTIAPMMGVKYHSVLIPTRPKVLTQSVFFSGFGDPEVYPRPDGTAYCCGFPDDAIVVTEEPGSEEVRPKAVKRIVDSIRNASGGTLNADPELSQSCYLPTTLDNLPIMGVLSGTKNCFVAAGHGCWGILMGPGTGETMASLMVTGQSTPHVKNLQSFSPSRYTQSL